VGGDSGPIDCCVCGGGFPLIFAPGWNFVNSSSPRLNQTKTSAHRDANDVVSGFNAPDRAREWCGRRQWPIGLLCVSGDLALFSHRDGT
jgi:hypothetical protein